LPPRSPARWAHRSRCETRCPGVSMVTVPGAPLTASIHSAHSRAQCSAHRVSGRPGGLNLDLAVGLAGAAEDRQDDEFRCWQIRFQCPGNESQGYHRHQVDQLPCHRAVGSKDAKIPATRSCKWPIGVVESPGSVAACADIGEHLPIVVDVRPGKPRRDPSKPTFALVICVAAT